MPFDTAAIQKTMAKKKAPSTGAAMVQPKNDIAIPQMQGVGGGIPAAPAQPKVVPNMPSLQQPQQGAVAPAGGNQEAGSFLQFANLPTPQNPMNMPPPGGMDTRGGPLPGFGPVAGPPREIDRTPEGTGLGSGLPGEYGVGVKENWRDGGGPPGIMGTGGQTDPPPDYDPSNTTSPGGTTTGKENYTPPGLPPPPEGTEWVVDEWGQITGYRAIPGYDRDKKLEDWMNTEHDGDFSAIEDQYGADREREQRRLAQQMAAMGMSQSGFHAGMANDAASQSMRDLASERMRWDQQQIQNEMQQAALLFQDKWHDMDLAQQEHMANVLHNLRLKQMEYEDLLASGKPGMAEAVLQDIKDSWNEFVGWFK